jgi:predicted esterase
MNEKPVCFVLHGCRQGIRDDKGRLDVERYANKLLKKTGKHSDVEFVEASYTYTDSETGQQQGKHWYAKQLQIADIPLGIPFEDGYMETINRLHDIIVAYGDRPVVLFGFSQGANVVDTYLAHHPEPVAVLAAVLFSGYGFVSTERQTIDVPTLYVGHPDDTIVPFPDGTVPYCSWMDSYNDLKVFTHDTRCKNSHGIPTRAKLLDEIIGLVFEQ